MRITIASASLVAAVTLRVPGAAAQSDPALRTPPPATGPNAPPAPVFASPPPVTVKDGFVYAVMGDISQVGPVTRLQLPEFEKVLSVVRRADFALANQEGVAFFSP